MKLDKEWDFIRVCPKTDDQLTHHQVYYSYGVCPSCGHDSKGTITHEEKVVGRWLRPSLWDRLRGRRTQFIRKEKQ